MWFVTGKVSEVAFLLTQGELNDLLQATCQGRRRGIEPLVLTQSLGDVSPEAVVSCLGHALSLSYA